MQKGSEIIFSSNSDEWTTPREVFDDLNAEFRFTLDAASTDENALCDRHFTQEQDGLKQAWGGEIVFCNPPYSNIAKWVEKAFRESRTDGTIVVLLIPARTDTRYFHDYILHRAEIRFIKGRLRFSGATVNAPFPSMIVIFRGAKC